ncbi:MAG TPA: hypothetical protein VF550_05250 [Polyangia bacterium]
MSEGVSEFVGGKRQAESTVGRGVSESRGRALCKPRTQVAFRWSLSLPLTGTRAALYTNDATRDWLC